MTRGCEAQVAFFSVDTGVVWQCDVFAGCGMAQQHQMHGQGAATLPDRGRWPHPEEPVKRDIPNWQVEHPAKRNNKQQNETFLKCHVRVDAPSKQIVDEALTSTALADVNGLFEVPNNAGKRRCLDIDVCGAPKLHSIAQRRQLTHEVMHACSIISYMHTTDTDNATGVLKGYM